MVKKENNQPTEVSHAKVIQSESFEEINVDEIINNPLQPRLHIDEKDLSDLAKSIASHGLIQPISVTKKDTKYILQAGQRRWLAHEKLGLKTIKAIVHEESTLVQPENEKSLFEIAIIENTQRENLDPLEFAMSLKNVMDKKLYKNKRELSSAVGKSASYIGKILNMLALDDKIIKDLSTNKSTNDVESLYEIQKITDKKEQVNVYFDFVKNKIDRKGLRELSRSKKNLPHIDRRYKFSNRAKVVKLEYDTSKLTDEQIQDINADLNEVLKKYFP